MASRRPRRTTEPWRPTKEELAAAAGKTIPDLIAPDLDVLFCGINPGLYSGTTGHHFAKPGNRFWKTLHLAGFTPRVLSPFEEDELLEYGLGITNLAMRTTATAAQLTDEELREGGVKLARKLQKYRPKLLAVLGVTAYRAAFGHKKAVLGPQPEGIGGVPVWVLPNPSGLNAHYQLPDLAALFGSLRQGLDDPVAGKEPIDAND